MANRYPVHAPVGQYTPFHLSALSQPVNTTPVTTIYAGTQTITPSSVSGIVTGQLFTFSGGTGASENVAVTNLTSADFQGTFANGHSGGFTVVATSISTTSSLVNATGSQTVTPASMTGIVLGISLHFAAGGGSAEDVVVTAVTATTFTATFTSTHTVGTAITLGTASNLTLTLTTNIGVAGSKTIAPASMTNITVGTLLHISAGTGSAEDVIVTATTANTFTATYANTHSSSWTITTPTTMSYIPVPNSRCVSTTSATAITAGSNVTVTPASIKNIYVGQLLNIANGTGTAEDVRVKAMNPTLGTFTADFVNNHSGAYTITSKGGGFLGPVIVNDPGTSCVITFYHGSPNLVPLPVNQGVIAVMKPTATGQSYPHAFALDLGLFYTVTGSAAADVTGGWIDMEI